MPLSQIPLTLLLSFVSITQTASAGCFWPDGTDRNAAFNATNNYTLTSDQYLPCSSVEGEVSMCCSRNDICQQNGMCYNPGYKIYWRESCSIPNWNDSENCIKLFVNESTDIVVTPCPGSASFCLGNSAYDCCNAGEGVFIVNGEQTTQNPNSTTSSSTGTTAAPTATTASSTSNPTSTSTPRSSGLSTGAKTGIGVGAALGVLLLSGLIAFFILRRRRVRRDEKRIASDPYHRGQLEPAEKPAFDTDSPVAHHTKRPPGIHEVHSDRYVPTVEMPAATAEHGRSGELAELGG